jgi:integrase
MAVVMTALVQTKSGAWSARKGVPKDIRDEYARIYGAGWEARFHAPVGTTTPRAKALFSEWLSEVENRIAALRSTQKGEGLNLNTKEARALAGEWYQWFVARHESDPGKPARWSALEDMFYDQIMQFAPDWYRENSSLDPDCTWAKEPEVRASMRPFVADNADTAQFLAIRGVVLAPQARDLFFDCVEEDLWGALELLGRRARGDYTPDTRLQTFPPPFALATKRPTNGPGRTCWELFDAWVSRKQPAKSTINRWRSVFLNLNTAFGNRNADTISEDEAKAWSDLLISPKRSARTVADVWVVGARTVFGWAVRERLATANPFKAVFVTVPKQLELRSKAFTPEEARIILNAASGLASVQKPFAAARRWVPWLAAYSGARIGELTQLRAQDIERGEIVAMRITPEAGSTKTNKARTVPIHLHVLEQGFLEYVDKIGEGPLFYTSDETAEEQEHTNPRRPRPVTTRQRLGEWVRDLGVSDKGIRPKHAWRYTFKQTAVRNGVTETIADEICGHAQLTTGRGYMRPNLEDMAAALTQFPRYKID